MPKATLTISSKNYSSWCLRGWLICKLGGLDFEEAVVSLDDANARAELLLLSPSFLVPCLTHDGAKVWDTLAIGEYVAEEKPEACLLPADRAARAHCRAICGEMHSGFANLRSALPMNLKAHHPGFRVWAGAQADIDRIVTIWSQCFATYGGPYLFGKALTLADAWDEAEQVLADRFRLPRSARDNPARSWHLPDVIVAIFRARESISLDDPSELKG